MDDVLDLICEHLRPALRGERERRRREPRLPLARGVTLVLVGHRAAGKSTLLRAVAPLLGRTGIDLDDELAKERDLREWVTSDQLGFRAAERARFLRIVREQPGAVIAAGGGFLQHHAEVLAGTLPVLVPVSFATYVERLSRDHTRPRLRPEVPLADELSQVWAEREALHRRVPTRDIVDLALFLERPQRPRMMVTLPPGQVPEEYAQRARDAGAELLEVRSDLTPTTLPLERAAALLPLIVSERGRPLPQAWTAIAELVDLPRGTAPPPGVPLARVLYSFHADAPLADGWKGWEHTPPEAQVKHIEPLGDAARVRLGALRTRLESRFRFVTVLPMGEGAEQARGELAAGNALDYLALDESFAAAPGQRRLAEALAAFRAS